MTASVSVSCSKHDDVKKFLHAYSSMRSAGWELVAALNQDPTAIYHNDLPRAESFLHQK